MISFAIALQIAAAPIIDWQPFPMQRMPAGGLFDRSSATRTGDVVRAWVRLLNVQLPGVIDVRQQPDAQMEVDCGKPLMRAIAFRVVRPDGSVLKAMDATPEQARWQRSTIGMRGYDVRVALCSSVR